MGARGLVRGLALGDTPSQLVGGQQRIQRIVCAGQSVVTFTGIPQTFSDLIVTFLGFLAGAAAASGVSLKINNDATLANYKGQSLAGSNAAATSAVIASTASGLVVFNSAGTALATNPIGASAVYIPGYSQTALQKCFYTTGYNVNGAADIGQINVFGGQWKSIAGINQLDFSASSNFQDGSVFTLYGVG